MVPVGFAADSFYSWVSDLRNPAQVSPAMQPGVHRSMPAAPGRTAAWVGCLASSLDSDEASQSEISKCVRPASRAAFRVAHELSLHIFGEHFFGVDGDEDASAAGQDFVLFVQDFGGVDVLAAVDSEFACLRRAGVCAGGQA